MPTDAVSLGVNLAPGRQASEQAAFISFSIGMTPRHGGANVMKSGAARAFAAALPRLGLQRLCLAAAPVWLLPARVQVRPRPQRGPGGT